LIDRHTYRDGERHTETEKDIQRRRQTYRDEDRHTETEKDIQRPIKTQRRIKTYRQGREACVREVDKLI